jgi:hypothetical protein
LGAPAYEAFDAMLRTTCTSLNLELLQSRNQMITKFVVENIGVVRPNGREVNTLPCTGEYDINDSPSFDVSYQYSLLRLHPPFHSESQRSFRSILMEWNSR